MSPRTANPNVPEALLEAARAEFARRGLVGARVEDVCRRAGVSKGAFYLHFKSKEDAFRAILARFLGVLEEYTRARTEQWSRFEHSCGALAAEDFETGSERFLHARELECDCNRDLLEIFWRNRQILSALDGASGKRYWELVHDFRQRMSAFLASSILTGRDTGKYHSDLDPEFVADALVGVYEAFARRMVSLREKPDLATWARNLFTLLHQGVLAPPRPAWAERSSRSAGGGS